MACKHPGCICDTIAGSKFCAIHHKMHMDDVKNFYQRIFVQVGAEKWDKFKEKLRKHAKADDGHNSIEFKKFELIINRLLMLKISPTQKEMLLDTCGRYEGNDLLITLSQVYNAQLVGKLNKIYDNLRINECTEDDAQDAAGFTGDF